MPTASQLNRARVESKVRDYAQRRGSVDARNYWLTIVWSNDLPDPRRGTRINRKIPLTLTSLDPITPFSEPGVTLLVNPQGCAARFGRPLQIGSAIRLDGLPVKHNVTARVVNCIRPGEYEKFWILGLMLDEPGNVWGIESPPADWHTSNSLAHSQNTL